MVYVRFRILVIALLVCCFSILPVFGQSTEEPEATETPQPIQEINGLQVVLKVDPAFTDFQPEDVRTAAEVIVRRLKGMGVEPYRVQLVNGTDIQVQFGGMNDSNLILEVLLETALLEFVDFSGLGAKVAQFEGLTIRTSAREADTDGQVNPISGEAFETLLTSADLKSAQAETASYNPNVWVINFELTDDGGTIFGDYTEAHVGEPLAIVLDGRVLSIPFIQSRLETQGSITGNFTQEEAERLAAQLQAGALQLPLTLASVSTVETITLEASE
jgi:protein-export membrane protein SecD